MNTRVGRWAALSLALLCARDAHAQETPQSTPSTFWQRAKRPEVARAQSLVRQARALLLPALRVSRSLGTQSAAHKRIAIEGALVRLTRARALTPEDPELLYLLGRGLSAWQSAEASDAQRRTQEAVACFEALRRVDPWYEAESVAYEVGVLRTRAENFAQAAEEYARALTLRLDESLLPSTLCNLAEVTMLAGDAQQAVALYERAVEESDGDAQKLARWGLVVALDRAGEQGRAQEELQRMLTGDESALRVLDQADVFFAPPFERDYYEALAALARARMSREDKTQSLAEAQAAFERYAAAAGADGLWTASARAHVTVLREERAATQLDAKQHALHGKPKRAR